MYRYFAWKEGGYWRGQQLLTPGQIRVLVRELENRHELFATIQHYDDTARIVGCPVYADFDHKDATLAHVQAEVQAFVFRTASELNVIPKIYFSGNKGFHVIIPYPVLHEQCHALVKEVVMRLGGDLKSLDKSVYRPRAMFRLPGSPASRVGFYKTQLTHEELFHLKAEHIVEMARTPLAREIQECDIAKIQEDTIEEWLKDAETRLPQWDDTKERQALQPMLTPCLQHFLEKGVDEGGRNKSVFILAKFLKASDVRPEEAEKLLLKQSHIAQWDRDGEARVHSIVSSVYRSRHETRLGCRKGADSEIMQAHCSRYCPFSPDFPEFTLRKAP
jgi:hypothetical protein